jgi:hypothetical protein
MIPSRLLLLLLVRQRRRGDRGFGLLLALLVALVTVISAVAMLSRTQLGWLGTAEASQSRLARQAAEDGLAMVIGELNRPANRRLLVAPVAFTRWREHASQATDTAAYASITNPCLGADPSGRAAPAPSATLLQIADPRLDQASISLGSPTPGMERRFLLQSVRLSTADRSRWFRSDRSGEVERSQGGAAYEEGLIRFDSASTVGAIELVVQGQALRGGKVVAIANLSREYAVVPKCCQRSLGGPGQIFGNDVRWCSGYGNAGFPALVVGLANTASQRKGGVEIFEDTTPELRQRTEPGERPLAIQCRLPAGSENERCDGEQEVDGVKIITTVSDFPDLPRLGSDGLPCARGDKTCLEGPGPSGAYALELFDHEGGASGNSPTNRYAKDYLRVNTGSGQVEICNKTYSPTGPYAASATSDGSGSTIDTTPTLVAGSCTSLAPYCARLVKDNYTTHHCRISTIFVNDFGATNDSEVRHNNTLFIDTSNGPIYLYVYDAWAKKSPDSTLLTQMQSFDYAGDRPRSDYAPIYTIGGYNDGQILHVYCPDKAGSSSDTNICVEPVTGAQRSNQAASNMTRAEILSDIRNAPDNRGDYAVLLGDDGFVRDLFFWMPSASFHIAGDPRILDLFGDVPQGKPQVSAGLWLNKLAFVRRTSQLYLPSPRDNYFPFLLTPQDRLSAVVHDWVARSATVSSLYQLLP